MVAQDRVRLSEPNDEGIGLVRLAFAWLTLEQTVTKQFWEATVDARLSDGQFA